MSKEDIKSLADEITEGFSLVKGPEIVNPVEREAFLKSNGGASIQIYPTIARAFPLVPLNGSVPSQIPHKRYFFENKSELNTEGVFPMNAQQCNALEAAYIIETSGLLVDALRHYVRGEEMTSWSSRISGLPIDTPDNSYINRMMSWFSEIEESEKINPEQFTVEQLKRMPKESIQGDFYGMFGEALKGPARRYLDAMGGMRQAQHSGVRDLREVDVSILRNLFKSFRDSYEIGMKAFKTLEDTSLEHSPAWVTSDGRDIQEGDYVQGIFIDRGYNSVEGNVTDVRKAETGVYLNLENAGESGFVKSGKGNERLENLLLSDKHWRSKMWKLDEGK